MMEGCLMADDKTGNIAQELSALIVARDVLQKQIDERVALRRQEMLLADSFYRERKTRRLASLRRNGR